MLRGYRLPAIALGLTALMWGVQANPVHKGGCQNCSTTQSAAEAKPSSPPSVPLAVQNQIERIARALETANTKQPPHDDSGKRSADAEENAAYWAFWMVVVGALETAVTLIGVALVARTLIHTRRAADAAQQSFRAMVRIERPYVTARQFEISPLPNARQSGLGDHLVTIWGNARNHGSRLGLVNGFGIAQTIEKLSLPPLRPDMEANFTPQTVGPDAERDWSIPLAISHIPEANLKLILKGHDWYFYGYFLYTDVQKIRRRSGFAFSYTAAEPNERGRSSLAICGPPEYWYDEEVESQKT